MVRRRVGWRGVLKGRARSADWTTTTGSSNPSHLCKPPFLPAGEDSSLFYFGERMSKGNDPTSQFSYVVDFNEHDNSEILRAILPRTKKEYSRTLCIFDK